MGVAAGEESSSRFNRTKLKTERARQLRRNVTAVERRLWQKLRGGQIDGANFRRQHPAGNYILDFYCSELGLAIELDGGQHEMGRDLARDEWLLRRGVIVLRFWNSDITENISGVLEAIAANVSELKAQRTASTVRWTPTPTLPLPGGGSAPSSRHR